MGRESPRSDTRVDARRSLASTPRLAALAQALNTLDPGSVSSGFIAVEGGVCTGKTTIVGELATKGVGVLVEYTDLPEYVGHPDHWPRTASQLASRLDHFLSLEQTRHIRSPRSIQPIVADRSLLSLVAFEYGLRAAGWSAFPDACLEHLTSAIVDTPGLVPKLIMVLETPIAIRRARAKTAGMAIRAPLLDLDFINGERLFFESLQKLSPALITFVEQQQAVSTILRACQSFTKAPAEGTR